MSLAATLGLCAMLVGAIGFAAKLIVDSEVLDVFALCGFCVSLGYIWGQLP